MSGGGIGTCRACGASFTRTRSFTRYCSDVCRFKAKVSIEDGHWIWTARRSDNGYGQFHLGKLSWAHRASYELFRGQIPDGLHIDHLCRIRECVNPAHLEAVTPTENFLRSTAPGAVAVRQGICKRGHEFTPENTYVRPDTGYRMCRACVNLRGRKGWAA